MNRKQQQQQQQDQQQEQQQEEKHEQQQRNREQPFITYRDLSAYRRFGGPIGERAATPAGNRLENPKLQ